MKQQTVTSAIWPSGTSVRWRSLTLGEHTKYTNYIKAGMPLAQVYLEVYEKLVISGPVSELVPAGIVDWIGKKELFESAFSGRIEPIAKLVNKKRDELSKDYILMSKGYISALLHYKLEELDDMTESEFFDRLLLVEAITGKQVDPIKDKKQVNKPTALSNAQKLAEQDKLNRQTKKEYLENKIKDRRARWGGNPT